MIRIFLIAALNLLACGCGRTQANGDIVRAGGDAKRGARLIAQQGCGSCHLIPGVRAANGLVGPPLIQWSRRGFIAGELPNTPANLVRWIQDPTSVEPKTAMPNLGITAPDARDMAAYLYTLR